MNLTARTTYEHTLDANRRLYDGFDLMLIGGRWRKGHSFKRIEDLNPYSGETLVTIQAASPEDVDEA